MEDKNQGTNIKNEVKGRGLFYGVIAVATFIIMAVGATFAYFTASTRSTNSTVQTGSTTLQLKYISYGSGWMNGDLIPADDLVVEYSFENQDDTTMKDTTSKANALCKDDDGNSICSVYVFQVTNDAKSEQGVSIDVVSEVNGFASLNAMAYEISLPEEQEDYESTEDNNGFNDPVFRKGRTDETAGSIDVKDANGELLGLLNDSAATGHNETYTPIYINRKGVTKTLLKYVKSQDKSQGTQVLEPAINRALASVTGDINDADESDVKLRTANIAGNIKIEGKETKTFALVLYIKNENIDQTETDADKTFTGRVLVSSGDGTGVSGSISMLAGAEDDLQSKKNSEPNE